MRSMTVMQSLFLALLALAAQLTHGQEDIAPSPAPSPAAPLPTSDSTAIDQGIAYVLLFVALLITYIIH